MLVCKKCDRKIAEDATQKDLCMAWQKFAPVGSIENCMRHAVNWRDRALKAEKQLFWTNRVHEVLRHTEK